MDRLILEVIAARHPEGIDGLGGDRFSRVALNPQPLPPRAVFLAAFAEEVIDRALLMQEVDELCGNSFKVRIPFPKPRHDEHEFLSGLELLAVGAVFEQNAATIAHEGLQQELRNAGARLIETGIGRM